MIELEFDFEKSSILVHPKINIHLICIPINIRFAYTML